MWDMFEHTLLQTVKVTFPFSQRPPDYGPGVVSLPLPHTLILMCNENLAHFSIEGVSQPSEEHGGSTSHQSPLCAAVYSPQLNQVTHTHTHSCTHTLMHTHSCTHTHAHTLMHTHSCTHTHAHTLMHTHSCTHTHAHTHSCTHTHAHTHSCTHTHAHILMHTHSCTHTHAHTHSCTHTLMHTHVHTHPHTYTCTHTPAHIHISMHTHSVHKYVIKHVPVLTCTHSCTVGKYVDQCHVQCNKFKFQVLIPCSEVLMTHFFVIISNCLYTKPVQCVCVCVCVCVCMYVCMCVYVCVL